jgi:hypothetical protein
MLCLRGLCVYMRVFVGMLKVYMSIYVHIYLVYRHIEAYNGI